MPGLRRPDRVGVQDRPRPLDSRRPVPPAFEEVDLGRRPGREDPRPEGRAVQCDAGIQEDLAAAGLPARGPRVARCTVERRMRALGLTGAGPGRTVRTTRPAKGNPVPARPAPAATPAAARCGPALGGRLHPRADPARGSSLHRLRHGACARRPHRRPGPPARARGTGARPAPWNRRPGARKHRDGGDPWGLVHHSDHGSKSPVHRLHRATRRRGHRSPRPEPWAPPCAGAAAQALGKPLQARGPCHCIRRLCGETRQAPASAGPVLARRPLEGPRRPPGPPPPSG